MENENNGFDVNESDEQNMQKILNSALIKELRKYKEENTKLKHEKEILYSIIENLEEENKALKSDLSFMKNQNPNAETIEIVENILQSKHEIKSEPVEYYNLTQNYSNSESSSKNCSTRKKLNTKAHIDNEPNNEGTKISCTLRLSKFKCEICNKEITGKHNFKVHMENVHKGIKKYKCDKCNKKFTRNTGLKLHITGVHEKIKRFKCGQCDKIFSKVFNLKLHIQTVHEKVKKFICPICEKGFGKSQHLKTHSILHQENQIK